MASALGRALPGMAGHIAGHAANLAANLAALPSHPHPQLDPRGAARQRQLEQAAKNPGEMYADAEALEAFAAANPDLIAQVTGRAIIDAAATVLAGKAAGAVNKAVGERLGFFGEEALSEAIEAGIKAFLPTEKKE